MSLDVYLELEEEQVDIVPWTGTGIFIRENGSTREITTEEWEEKFPGREPVKAMVDRGQQTVYESNITHNLGKMAQAAGLRDYLWAPEEVKCFRAADLIEPLEKGLLTLKQNPRYLKTYNPPNGWGDYDGLVRFVSEYLDACRKWPTAKIQVSR